MGRLYIRLREEAERRGYNKLKLAQASGLDYQTVSRLWDNQIKRLDFITIERLAQTLGVPAMSLLMEVEEEEAGRRKG